VPLAFYVYYRIDPQAAAIARQRVDTLLERVQQRCGVRGRLMTKRDEPNLWMEIYEDVVDAPLFESGLAAEAACLGLEALLLPGSERRMECFQE
jgi:hypothetical protein